LADIKLFEIGNGAKEYKGQNVALEKELQNIIEKNMNTFFGVTFLASEYSTTDGGRMDSIGIDENNCPVIFEYKRSVKENVINQGLFYLNWLLDHKDSFKVLVINNLGLDKANDIDWSMPRVICIAGDFTKYDESAIKQMDKNISLIRYKKFGDNLLMFECINENVMTPNVESNAKHGASDYTFKSNLNNTSKQLKDLYETIRNYILSLGDDITENHLKKYTAFKKIKNLVCIEVQRSKIILHLSLDVDTMQFEDGFSRNTTDVGHFGTGDVELTITNKDTWNKAKPFIERAYNEN
jgi:predicted transport protein